MTEQVGNLAKQMLDLANERRPKFVEMEFIAAKSAILEAAEKGLCHVSAESRTLQKSTRSDIVKDTKRRLESEGFRVYTRAVKTEKWDTNKKPGLFYDVVWLNAGRRYDKFMKNQEKFEIVEDAT